MYYYAKEFDSCNVSYSVTIYVLSFGWAYVDYFYLPQTRYGMLMLCDEDISADVRYGSATVSPQGACNSIARVV